MEVDSLRGRLAAAPGVAVDRVRPSAGRIAEAAVAAAIAWLLAGLIPGHPSPVFAPIAALIALTASPGQRGRQAAQLILGILIGVVVANLFVVALGRGAWQMALLVLLALTLTTAAGLSAFMVAQAAIWSVIVLSLHGGYSAAAGRLLDGLVGAAVAVVFTQLLFPVDPIGLIEGAGRPFYTRLADVLRRLGDAVEQGDEEAARDALSAAEQLDDRRLREALHVAREIVRRAPRRRRRRSPVSDWSRAAGRLDATERDLVVLATGVVRAVRSEERPPPELADGLRAAAELYEQLPDLVAEDATREPFDRCAARAVAAARAIDEDSGFGVEIAVRQLGALVRDARRAAGDEEAEQQSELPVEL